MGILELLVVLGRVALTWFQFRYDPKEVQRRRVMEARDDALDRTLAFRQKLVDGEKGEAVQEFWKLIRESEVQV